MTTIKISRKGWENAGKKMGWLKKSQLMESDGKWREELMKHSERVADDLCKSINQTVPASVDGMPYARQWVLEEAIKILQERV